MIKPDLIEEWIGSLLARKCRPLEYDIAVEGRVRRHVGPTMLIAAVGVVFRRSEKFRVENELVLNLESESEAFLRAAIFGMLDVLMVSDLVSIDTLEIVLKTVELDPIESSQWAFREAGRDAGRKMIKKLR